MNGNTVPHPTKFVDPCNTCTKICSCEGCAYYPKPTHDEEDYQRALNSSMSWEAAHRLVYGSNPPRNPYQHRRQHG